MTQSTLRVLMAVAACCAPARADRSSIDAGLKAFEQLDYERAVALLNQAFGEAEETDEKLIVLRTLAFAHVALNQEEQARAEFRLALHLDPTMMLDATISPRTRLVFEEARAEMAIDEPRPSPSASPPPVTAPPAPALPPAARVDSPRPSPRPLYRRGWIWGTAAGATAVIVIGVIAGIFAQPATAHLTVAHP
jgi:hypothetical protein